MLLDPAQHYHYYTAHYQIPQCDSATMSCAYRVTVPIRRPLLGVSRPRPFGRPLFLYDHIIAWISYVAQVIGRSYHSLSCCSKPPELPQAVWFSIEEAISLTITCQTNNLSFTCYTVAHCHLRSLPGTVQQVGKPVAPHAMTKLKFTVCCNRKCAGLVNNGGVLHRQSDCIFTLLTLFSPSATPVQLCLKELLDLSPASRYLQTSLPPSFPAFRPRPLIQPAICFTSLSYSTLLQPCEPGQKTRCSNTSIYWTSRVTSSLISLRTT